MQDRVMSFPPPSLSLSLSRPKQELSASLYKNIILAQVADITVITEKIMPEEVYSLLECIAEAHYQDSHHFVKCKFYKVGLFLKRGLRLVVRILAQMHTKSREKTPEKSQTVRK